MRHHKDNDQSTAAQSMPYRSILVSSDNLEWPRKAYTTRTVWPTAIKFCTITHVREKRVLGDQPRNFYVAQRCRTVCQQ